MKDLRFSYPGATAMLSYLDESVVLIVVVGLVTAAMLASLRLDTAKAARGTVRAFVVDFTRCAVVLSDSEWDAALMPGTASPIHMVSGAWVVPSMNFPQFRAKSFQLAAAGYPRRAFLNAQDAMDWAKVEARLPQW